MSDRPTSADCIFCAIVAGDIPGRIVHETDDVLAFLDANPLSPGHTLVIPKGHFETISETPSADFLAVSEVLYDLIPAIEQAVDADASNVGFNDGPASGQEVPHVHGHVIPRFEDDGGRPIHAVGGTAPDLSAEELDEIAERITGVAA